MRALVVVTLLLLAACSPKRGDGYEKALSEARSARHVGHHAAAADKFTEASRAAKIPHDAAYARYEAAIARARSGDVARAAQEFRALANEQPPSAYAAEGAYKAAELAYKSDPRTGSSELEAFIVRFPQSGVARSALLQLLRDDDDGGPAKTLAHLEGLAPRVAGKEIEEDVAYERAKRLDALNRNEAALEAYLAIAKRWPYPTGNYFDDSLFHASEIEERLGRPREGIAHLERLLSYRESSTMIGTYERARYVPAILRIAKLYEERLHDRAKARETLHRLYTDFKTSTARDDALWQEADLWSKDGNNDKACARLDTLVSDFPDSRYVPCASEKCPSIKRPSKSKAPSTCHPYLESGQKADDANETNEN